MLNNNSGTIPAGFGSCLSSPIARGPARRTRKARSVRRIAAARCFIDHDRAATAASTFARNDVDGQVAFNNGGIDVDFDDNIYPRACWHPIGRNDFAANYLTGSLHYWTDPLLLAIDPIYGNLVYCAHTSCFYAIDLGKLVAWTGPSGAYADLTVAGSTVTPSTASLAGYTITPNDTTHSLVITHHPAGTTTTIKINSLHWNEVNRAWDGWVLASAPSLVSTDTWALDSVVTSGKIRNYTGTTVTNSVWDFEHTEINSGGPLVEVIWQPDATSVTNCCSVGTGGIQIVGNVSSPTLAIEHNTFNCLYWYGSYYGGNPVVASNTLRSNVFFGVGYAGGSLQLVGVNIGIAQGTNNPYGIPYEQALYADEVPAANTVANIIVQPVTPTGSTQCAVSAPANASPISPTNLFTSYVPCCWNLWFSGSVPAGFTSTFNTTPGSTTNASLDPQLIDPTANLANWARKSIGYTALNAALGTSLSAASADYLMSKAAVDYISVTDRTLTRTALIPWVQSMLAPTNAALYGTAHDASSPVTAAGGWPGAVPGLLPSAMVLTSNHLTTRVGTTVTFTADVTDPAAIGTPAGSVQFTVDGANLGAAVALAAGAAATTWTATFGSHTIGASYGGSSSYLASAATSLSETVTSNAHFLTTLGIGA